jgi:GNAT superfamily N-acetyltransferase
MFEAADKLWLEMLPSAEAMLPEIVVNAQCRADVASGVGVFEPVGTPAQYRKRGLTKLAIHEARRRSQRRGLETVRVGTALFNKPAIAAYSSAGFEAFDRTHWWTKRLGPT